MLLAAASAATEAAGASIISPSAETEFADAVCIALPPHTTTMESTFTRGCMSAVVCPEITTAPGESNGSSSAEGTSTPSVRVGVLSADAGVTVAPLDVPCEPLPVPFIETFV